MKHFRTYNLAFCICFTALLLAPLAFFNFTGTVSSENRMLVNFPPLPQSFSQVSGFTDGVEKWLTDRIGFRKKMLTLYHCIKIYGFGVSPSDIVVLGRHDSAFLIRAAYSMVKNEEILEALGEDGSGRSLQDAQLVALRKDAEAIRRSPRKVVVLAVPTAPLFRFDDLPRYVRMTVSPTTPADHPVGRALAAFAAENAKDAAHFLFPYREGAEIAKRYAPFPRRNFHWSWSPFTTMISELMAERLGQPVARPWTSADFTACTTSSDLSLLVGAPFRNTHDVCPSGEYYTGMKLTSALVSDAFPGLDDTRTVSGTYYKNEGAETGKVLVVGDSFNYSLGMPLSRNFREVVVLDYYGVMRETHGHPDAIFSHIMEAYQPTSLVIVRHNCFFSLPDMPGMEIFLQ